MSLPVPINWLRGYVCQIPPGLLVFVVNPLQHLKSEYGDDDEPINYTCAAIGTGKDSNETPYMPGPLSFAVPVESSEEKSVQEKTSRMMNAILGNLDQLFQREKSLRDYGDGVQFTPEPLASEIIQANPDAITAVRITDNDDDKLWEIWVYWYQWDSGEWK
jgi:hypothetical protein